MALTRTEHDIAASSIASDAAAVDRSHAGLTISIRTGAGSGRTLLSAFDHALLGAGVGNFNLVTLSSVIPTASRLEHVDGPLRGGHGDLLYCVRAEAFTDQPGDVAWAGLGWVTDKTGAGLFVEHHGHTEAAVVALIEQSLTDMTRSRGGGYGEIQMTLASATCVDQPVCALVLAAYRVSSWRDGSEPRQPGGVNLERRVQSPAAAAAPAPAGSGTVARVSVEKEVDYATARLYYPLYLETFSDLLTQAAGRQLLHEEEFLAEMHDPRIDKYVAWDKDDVAIGMTTLTTDLEAVPWVSPEYFAHRYPEHHARGAIYYLGFTLVHPDHRGAHVFHAMIEAMIELVVANRGVVGWDMCQANDERGLGGSAGRLLTAHADVTIEPVDRQNYYAATFHGPGDTPAGKP